MSPIEYGATRSQRHAGGLHLCRTKWVIKTNANKPIAQRTDWRLLNELKNKLATSNGEPWTTSMRESMRGTFVRCLSRCGKQWEERGDHLRGIHYYQRGIEADAQAEEFYQGLMRWYQSMGRRAEAMSGLSRLRQTLAVTRRIQTSAASETLGKQVIGRPARHSLRGNIHAAPGAMINALHARLKSHQLNLLVLVGITE